MMNVDYTHRVTSVAYNSAIRELILDAFGAWIKQHVKLGYDPYLLSFMFDHLPGSEQARIQQMHDQVTIFYRKLITHVERDPTLDKNAHKLPRGVFFPDVPAYKRKKQGLLDVTVNDGLHMHGVLVIPDKSRLKTSLDEHVLENYHKYRSHKMYRIDVVPMDARIVYTTDYAGKALKTPRFDQDDILILPKTTSELEPGLHVLTFKARQIRDVQSRYNVSEEVAWTLVSNRRLLENVG
jgi:hypothetical protein